MTPANSPRPPACDGVDGLLSALVREASVNPDGDPGVAETGEENCARRVGAFLEALGAEVSYQYVAEGRPNVIGRFPSDRPGKPRLFFAPHLDTVSVVGMTIDPFSGEIRDGKLWGRGATDTKGCMAAMLWALKTFRDRIASAPVEIWFVGLMGEEAGQLGSKAFTRDYRPEGTEAFALVGEPTAGTIVHAHKGSCHLRITTHGHAVHSSDPTRGSNAIYAMMEVIAAVRGEITPWLHGFSNAVLGAPTLSVGTIRGGSKINIVPDRCEITVDIRTIPELYDPQSSALEGAATLGDAIAARLRKRVPEVEVAFSESEPLWTDPAHPFVTALERAGMRPGGAPWFCDAALFAKAGIPAVAAGPGSIAQAHTKDEFLSLDDLHEGVAFYLRFLEELTTS
ncbi:MAG TPA: M20 family metallopeptidase [Chthoniobacteraceae bacterium]|nr:M20 family metallopeptidase [Chthoniobacteraceae bacterium]